MKIILISIVVLLFISCSDSFKQNPELPPEFTLMCSPDGLFNFKDYDGYISSTDQGTNRETVIKRAWLWYEFLEKEKRNKHRKWTECKE